MTRIIDAIHTVALAAAIVIWWYIRPWGPFHRLRTVPRAIIDNSRDAFRHTAGEVRP